MHHDPARPSGRQCPHAGMAVLLLVTVFAFVNYAGLLSVLPMWAAAGGAASIAVGGVTGVMMAATVVTQIASPLVFRLLRLRQMMIIGAVLLGAPTPLYLLSTGIGWIMIITIVRGVGFALIVVAGAALVAELSSPGRLSSAAATYGAAAALPNLGALAGGVWVAETWGFRPVFIVAGVTCVIGAVISVALPSGPRGRFARTSAGDLVRLGPPLVLFLLTAASFGAVTTFLPVVGINASHVSLALLVASAALVVGRLGAGRIGGRLTAGQLLVPAALVVALGLGLVSFAMRSPSPALLVGVLLVGAVLVGAGFGVCQNDSFVATIERLGPTRTGTASAVWNIAYDGSFGLGAVVVGAGVGLTGHANAFLSSAVVVALLALVAGFVNRRLTRR